MRRSTALIILNAAKKKLCAHQIQAEIEPEDVSHGALG